MCAVAGAGAGDEVDANLEVGACFAEGGVGGFGEDPGMEMRWLGHGCWGGGLHFGFCDATLGICLLSSAQNSHQDRLAAATRSDACSSWRCVEHG